MLKKKAISTVKIKIKERRHAISAFAAPVIIMVIALAITGIYPFGDNQIAVIDMYHQYVPFLSELQYKFHNGGSLFYSWHGAGGFNFWNLLSYYGASPLNLLLILLPQSLLMEGVTFVLLIKIGLAGSFMFMYLKHSQKLVNGEGKIKSETETEETNYIEHGGIQSPWVMVAFSTLYGLNAFIMGYFWCIMWMDAVMLLPLCILGLHRLIEESKVLMYTITLSVIVFSNYYIAIMVCIFILFYYPVLYFLKVRGGGRKRCIRTTLLAAGCSIIGIAMSAVMLLPTYISMQSTYYIKSSLPESLSFFNAPLEVINQLLPEAQLTFREGLPNIYCGLIVVIMFSLFIWAEHISLREKLLNGIFLVFMFFSLNINTLDFIWHGFHFPNQLPFRYSFVICFVLIGIAYRTILGIDKFRPKVFITIAWAGAIYYLLVQKILEETLDSANTFFYVGITLLMAYCLSMLFYSKRRIDVKALVAILCILVCAEMSINVISSFDKVGNTSRTTYNENMKALRALAASTEEKSFARTEMDESVVLNCPALYHYRGMSQFSSTVNSNTTGLMEKIGLEGAPGKNRFNYNETDPVTNAMLNIRFMLTKDLELEDGDFVEIEKKGHSRLYESKYPLSIGYMTPHSIRTWDYNSDNPFENLNDYVRAATEGECRNVFKSLPYATVTSRGRTVSEEGYSTITVATDGADNGGVANVEYVAREAAKHYVFVEADNAESIYVKRENSVDDIAIQSDCGSIVNIGELREGESFRIEIEYEEDDGGTITAHVCTLDYEQWNRAYALLEDETINITKSSDTCLKGTIESAGSGVLVTSVPYDKGWTLKVDGRKKKDIELIGGAWICTALDEGTHEIELRFRPPGIIAGFIITIAAIAAMIAINELIRSRYRRFHEVESDCSKELENHLRE